MTTKPKIGKNRGNAGKGRPKGSRNKTTLAAKEAIALAAEGLGGTERLVAWAQEAPKNELAFWTQLYGKLVPLDTNVNGEITLKEIGRRIIDGQSSN